MYIINCLNKNFVICPITNIAKQKNVLIFYKIDKLLRYKQSKKIII